MTVVKTFYFLFGAFTILGGAMGYAKARSTASLVAGGISGALLIVAGALLPTTVKGGLVLGLIVSAALAGRFLPAFITKKNIFPAGVMALLSIASLVLTILALHPK